MNVVYENEFLNGKYAQSYIKKKTALRTVKVLEQVKNTMFLSLGSLVALSQVTEHVLTSLCNMIKVSRKKPDNQLMEQAFSNAMKEFDADNIELERSLTLSVAVNNIIQCGLLKQYQFEDIRFISDNRNLYTHNYFMRYPGTLSNIDEMKTLINSIFYTVLALNQIINLSYIAFKEEVLKNNPELIGYIEEFNKMFIGEFKG